MAANLPAVPTHAPARPAAAGGGWAAAALAASRQVGASKVACTGCWGVDGQFPGAAGCPSNGLRAASPSGVKLLAVGAHQRHVLQARVRWTAAKGRRGGSEGRSPSPSGLLAAGSFCRPDCSCGWPGKQAGSNSVQAGRPGPLLAFGYAPLGTGSGSVLTIWAGKACKPSADATQLAGQWMGTVPQHQPAAAAAQRRHQPSSPSAPPAAAAQHPLARV